MYYEDAISSWQPAPETTKSGLPVPDDQYINNVRANCLLDLPVIESEKEHDKIMVMVCGGPTAKLFLEDIKRKRNDDRYRIFCSNKTHDWLISNGVIPHYQFIIDPKPCKVDDVKNPHKNVEYIVGISCDNAVFKALEGYNVKRVLSVSGIGKPSDIQVVKVLLPYEEPPFLLGGTMAGLRAMGLADLMGYTHVEYYGFDSCYFDVDDNGDPIYYSYEKMRKENILEAQTEDGRIFLTSPVFASQANQYLKWKHRFEWIDFTIFGDSLTATIDKTDNEKMKPKHNLLITDYHKTVNKELHLKGILNTGTNDNPYGVSGHMYAGQAAILAGQIIKKYGNTTMLDYGCGQRTLEAIMPPIEGLKIFNYDPCIEGLDSTPEPADIVVCTDVLEHVEPDCLENVLDDLKRVTMKVAIIAVSTRLANKSYCDGQNAHKIVQDQGWWRPKIKKRFFITETQVMQDKFMYVLQAKGIR